MGDYITINEISVGNYEEKHSKFTATLYPVTSEAEANEILAAHKKKYFDAKHNVYAFVLHDNTARFSDDGEPHGTAAKPMLETLIHSGITDALIVCTRYFGGILLGTGGLVRAYTCAAKEAIENAIPIKMTECSILSITVPYNMQSLVMSLFSDMGITIINTEFSDNVIFEIAMAKPLLDEFSKKLCELTSDKLRAEHKADKILPINAKN
ncbi:MAG: YigZ family protein [Clostridia bacterium]|nr:YigZ family protein [Clostridia bacterium]